MSIRLLLPFCLVVVFTVTQSSVGAETKADLEKSVLDHLASHLTDPEYKSMQPWEFEIVARLDVSSYEKITLKALKNKDAGIQYRAIRIAHRSGGPVFVKPVAKLLKAKDDKVRGQAQIYTMLHGKKSDKGKALTAYIARGKFHSRRFELLENVSMGSSFNKACFNALKKGEFKYELHEKELVKWLNAQLSTDGLTKDQLLTQFKVLSKAYDARRKIHSEKYKDGISHGSGILVEKQSEVATFPWSI